MDKIRHCLSRTEVTTATALATATATATVTVTSAESAAAESAAADLSAAAADSAYCLYSCHSVRPYIDVTVVATHEFLFDRV